MSWFTTGKVDEFLAEAGEFLRAEPARNTVVLSVTENLRVRAATPAHRTPPAETQLFGWWRAAPSPSGPVGAAFMHTPRFPILLTAMTSRAAVELDGALAAIGRQVPGVDAGLEPAEAFAAAWRRRTGGEAEIHRRMRLFRLGELIRPEPGPEGTARPAAGPDRDLLIEWFDAFVREIGDPPREDHGAAVDDRLGYGGITIWEADGVPVSIAGVTRAAAGMVRVGSVYTPPERRGRGYAGAVTAAVSQAALDAGAREVVLFTDLANPTSNALYQRLGYQPVEDRVTLSLEPRA